MSAQEERIVIRKGGRYIHPRWLREDRTPATVIVTYISRRFGIVYYCLEENNFGSHGRMYVEITKAQETWKKACGGRCEMS